MSLSLFFYMHLTASRRGFNIYPLQLRQVVEQDNKKFYAAIMMGCYLVSLGGCPWL